MDFDLSPEQQLILETARRIGEAHGPAYWLAKDRAKAFPAELWKAVGEAGLAGIALPEQYGGAGLGMVEMALVIEALAAAGAGATVGQVFMISPIFGGLTVLRFGSDPMRADLLPKIASGETIVCMALTEPDAGSNSFEIRSFARADGDGWRLSGQKIWTTGVDVAQKMLVIARTLKPHESPRRTEGLSLFLIDVKREGLSFTPIEKTGTHTLSSSQVFFDDVRIEPSELVGTLHQGWKQLLDVLNSERIATTAGLVGAGQLALKLGIDYANGRKVFGDRPIAAYQGLQFPVAQSYAELECARVMNYKAAWLFDKGRPNGAEANTAKLLAARAAELATDRAMQMMGGMGYARDSHIERLWRDTRLFRIAPVSEEMILNFIATQNLGMPRSY